MNQFFDIIILLLRIALIFVIYFFIYLVVRVITREFNSSARRRTAYPEPEYVQQERMAVPPLNPTTGAAGRLVVIDSGNATTLRPGAVLALQPVTPIGRRPDNAIILDDNFVSSQHSLIALRDGSWWLSDVASTNGTFLNDKQIQQPQKLNWGDVIGVGGVRFRLEP